MVNDRPRRLGEIRITRQISYRIDPGTPPNQIKPRFGGVITEIRGNRVTETTTPQQRRAEAAQQIGEDARTTAKIAGKHVGRAGKSAAKGAVRLGLSQLRQTDGMGQEDTDAQTAGLVRQGAAHARHASKSITKGSVHAAVVVAKRFRPHAMDYTATKKKPSLLSQLTRGAARRGAKAMVSAGRSGVRTMGAMGSSIRDGGSLDVDRASVKVTQAVWRKSLGITGRASGKVAKKGARVASKWVTRQARRAGQWAATKAAASGLKVGLGVVRIIGVVVGAAGAMLPVLALVVGIVAVLCAILPGFITGVGAEQERQRTYGLVGACSGPSVVTAEQVAEFLSSPRGTDVSGSLSDEQRAIATAIVEEGQRAGIPPRGWAVALMTAMQESTLGADPASKEPNGDGDVGVFQQRGKVGWYADGATKEENTEILNDVRYAARTFYLGHDVGVRSAGGAGDIGYHIPGLVDVKDWESMDLGKAAQKVQKSAFPDYYGNHEATVASLLPTLSAQGCATSGANGLAGVDDYAPWYNALPESERKTRWDPMGFAWQQCTSYSAFAVRNYTGYTDFRNFWRGAQFGNANTWDDAADAAGIRVDQTPAVGAVAQRESGTWGHVAFIVAVNSDGSFVVNEYNHVQSLTFSTRTVRIGAGSDNFANILHFEESL